MSSRKRQFAFSILVLLLACGLLTGLIVSGCGKSKSDSKSKSKRAKSKPKVDPLLKDWKQPAAALLISGDMNGYLEPCGCTLDSQMGGLAHRADLLKKLREERKWQVAGLDLGGLVTKRPNDPNLDDLRTQDRIKLKKSLEALKQLGYEAVGLGDRELRIAGKQQADSFLADFLSTLEGTDEKTPPFLSANASVVYREQGKILQTIGPKKKSLTFKVGGKTIGVTSIVGESIKQKLIGKNTPNIRIAIDDVEKSLKEALAELKKAKPDLQVLLSYASTDESRKLAKAFPDFHVVVTSGGPEDGYEKPQKIGKTMLICVGAKGKHVGVLGFYPDSKEEPLKFELVELDRHRFGHNAMMHALMKSYQQELIAQNNAVFADVRYGPHPNPNTATFVGVDNCKDCHTKAYAKWKTTKHAHAYQSLIEGRPDQKKAGNVIPRNHDPECLACHVTGWEPMTIRRYDSGFLIKERTTKANASLYTNLRGQQCENCHGPGSEHVKYERQWQAAKTAAERMALDKTLRKHRLAIHLTKENVKQQKTCYRCHDLDNSPNFDFDKYWPKVEHKGKD